MLHARPVEGFYRRLRWGLDAFLIAVLFAVPWLELRGVPLFRLDIPTRQFQAFGLVIFPQELFFLWLIVIGLALALFFFTALAGRLWCGWACPQTVFTDVFAGIARRVQGWKRSTPPRQVAPWRIAATHAIWIAICLVTGFHLVAYFQSPYEMAAALVRGDASATTLGFVGFASTLAYADFGFVRQTFCKYLCPYARFQGVLFDPDTLVIGYDRARGEPRGKRGKTEGDCIDCGLCVAVCPSEIDIRDGLQLECIACTQCIDACDGVMAKLERPRGLIDYRSEVGLERLRPVRILRPRVLVYGVLLLAAVGLFAQQLAVRDPVDLQVLRNRAALYQRMPDGRIGNAYTLHVQNRARADEAFQIRLEAPEGFELVAGVNPLPVPGVTMRETSVFVVADATRANGRSGHEIRFSLAGHELERRARFVFPIEEALHDE